MNENTQVGTFRPVTVAPQGTPCGWNAYGETGTKLTCEGSRDAIHILTVTLPVAQAGTALCAYHSPFDPTDEERATVGQPRRTNAEAGAKVLAAQNAMCDDGKCGVCADCVECAQVAESGLNCFQEAMAEAERDEMIAFNESDPSTWSTLPVGYRWVTVDAANGEEHLISPDGRDVSAYGEWLARMGRDPQVEMIGGQPYGRASKLPIFYSARKFYTALNPAPFADHRGPGHEVNLAGQHRGNRFCVTHQVHVGIPTDGDMVAQAARKLCACGCGYPTAQANGYVRGHKPQAGKSGFDLLRDMLTLDM